MVRSKIYDIYNKTQLRLDVINQEKQINKIHERNGMRFGIEHAQSPFRSKQMRQ